MCRAQCFLVRAAYLIWWPYIEQNKTRAQQENTMKLTAEYGKQEERVLTIAADLEGQINQKAEKVRSYSR